jgi:hypothetical protein
MYQIIPAFDEAAQRGLVELRVAMNFGNDALVPYVATELLQARAIRRLNLHAALLRLCNERLDARIGRSVLGEQSPDIGIAGREQLLDGAQSRHVA